LLPQATQTSKYNLLRPASAISGHNWNRLPKVHGGCRNQYGNVTHMPARFTYRQLRCYRSSITRQWFGPRSRALNASARRWPRYWPMSRHTFCAHRTPLLTKASFLRSSALPATPTGSRRCILAQPVAPGMI